MASTTRNATAARITAGLLTMAVVSWIWASTLCEHQASRFFQETPPAPPETRAPRQVEPPRQDVTPPQDTPPRKDATPQLATPDNAAALRRAATLVRSWLAHQKSPPADPPHPEPEVGPPVKTTKAPDED